MINELARVLIIDPMGIGLRANGLMANEMAREPTIGLTEPHVPALGKTANTLAE